MDFEDITYAVQGTTAIVTLNRPEKRNALSGQLLRELNAALLEADEHNAVHCVVLRGAGPHFCAGADLSEYSSGRGPEYRGRQEIDDDVWRLEQGQRLRDRAVRHAQAGDRAGAWHVHRHRHRAGVVLRHGHRGGRCADRLSAGARPGHAARLDVAVSLRAAMGEAAAADRRQPDRQGRGARSGWR